MKHRRLLPMFIVRATLVIILSLLQPSALQADSCLPEFLALDVLQPMKIGEAFSHRLKSHKVGGIFLTDFAMDGVFEDKKINITFQFKAGTLGLPYNIYMVLVATETEVLAWHDYTIGCTEHGKSIFHGQTLTLPSIKNIKLDTLNLRLIVWGR
jgi:hypothetical protein